MPHRLWRPFCRYLTILLISIAGMRLAPSSALAQASVNAASGAAQCQPNGAEPTAIRAINLDGTFLLKDGQIVTLDGLLWPDADTPKSRAALRETLLGALEGAIIAWKPLGPPDRWGHIPAHLFVNEPQTGHAPFWLQVGIAEKGLVPLWPGQMSRECWRILRQAETIAFSNRRGYWAPRAQSFRRWAIRNDPRHHEGRHFVLHAQPQRIRAGRALIFVNLSSSNRHGPTLMLTKTQKDRLTKAGKNPDLWLRQRLMIRFIVPSNGLSRIRIETADHVDLVAAP
jgi:hypothetical protein